MTAFTTACHVFLSWARTIHSAHFPSLSLRPILLSFFHSRHVLPSRQFVLVLPINLDMRCLLIRATCPAHPIPAVQIMTLHMLQSPPQHPPPPTTPTVYVLRLVCETDFLSHITSQETWQCCDFNVLPSYRFEPSPPYSADLTPTDFPPFRTKKLP
jgi:hypothetical protein